MVEARGDGDALPPSGPFNSTRHLVREADIIDENPPSKLAHVTRMLWRYSYRKNTMQLLAGREMIKTPMQSPIAGL